MSQARVFIVDDDEAVRLSTLAVLSANAIAAAAFDSAEAFLAGAGSGRTGCVLLDYRMPGINGLEALGLIHEASPALAVVMISAHADVAVAVEAMKSGAIDLLEKPWELDALLDAVRRALDASDRRAARIAEQTSAQERLGRLTPREHDVFEELITGAPNKIIAYRLELSTRTVEFHRARVLEKTNAHSIAELVTLKAQAEPR